MALNDINSWSDPQIAEALAPFDVAPDATALRCVRKYMTVLALWNAKVSLTSIAGVREALQRHFGESMFAARAVPIAGGRLADVGTGAGFPGLALKIAVPGLQVSLIESSVKKAAFLAEVVRNLELSGVFILRQRTEELTLSPKADWIAARAVGHHEDLLAWARGNLAPGGRVVLWLGAADAGKLREMRAWSWKEPIPLPQSRDRVLQVGNPK
ncbi:MAG TPA: 16S rRNA (guanine(527)-N(7))-methyltransferase RsmG [Candidatus Acidoferrales bacterium]